MSNFELNLEKYAKELGIQLNEGGLTTGITPAIAPTVGSTLTAQQSADDPFATAINSHPAVVAAQKQAATASQAMAQAHLTAIKDIMAKSGQHA